MGGADQERLVRTASRRQRRQVLGGGADWQRCAARTLCRPRSRARAALRVAPPTKAPATRPVLFPRAEIDAQMLTIDHIDPKIQIDKAFEHFDQK